MHDPYPFVCYPPPYDWKDPGHKQKQAFFKSVSDHAKFSGFPSMLLKDWMGGYFPNFIKTGIVIPHQDSEVELNHSVNPTYFDASKFNLLHAGNLMKQRNPEGLIKGFKLFLDNNPKAKEETRLLLLGNAAYHKSFIEKNVATIPEIHTQLSNVPFDEVYSLQKKVSVNIILEANSEISPFLPGKFPHCISAKKLILHLGPLNSETKRLLGEEYEYHSRVDDVGKIALLIERLYYIWKEDPNRLVLYREDLLYYISKDYLKKSINDLLNRSSL
ncbi:hypothetical protein [Thalassobellus suaedae]|uniref:Glycosyltransferase n=1 Tax=Thalassobellus suaedae TaxID=3074124 RepID=A0ABY9Y081_9FLAO|nr:hypothetical protein RHP49_12080 [Flavobacteriaceae bacterium HL-DH10]